MTSLTEKAKNWRTNETIRGLVPYLLFFVVLFLLNQRFDYVRTNLTKTADGLETRTMYLRQVGADFCVGDMVRFRSANRRSGIYSEVIAAEGSVFSLTDTGYQIDEKTKTMTAEWLVKARLEMGENETLTVPAGYVLFTNSEFETTRKSKFWAFEVVPRENVTDRVSHILFSRDLSRIGDKVGKADPTCRR